MSGTEKVVRVCCDSLVALGQRSETGRPVFAKNSDRPVDEAQPLIQVAAAEHAPGSRLRCQYIEIDQVARTHAFVGSRPYWLWGCEHGVNEHGVAVGNQTIYTRDPVADIGLQGMDLVRLALERAQSARQAVDVIVGLVEAHGQGGSGFRDLVWPYNNSFVAADGSEAYVLEASARHWARKRVRGGGSASNHTTIGTDWDELSADCIEHAVASGWWDRSNERFDFAKAYRDESIVPGVISSGRYRTTSSALAPNAPRLQVRTVKRLMRDHYDSGEVHLPGRAPDDEKFFSVCMHSPPVGVTAASMVVELAPACGEPLLCWVAFCNPCIAPYLPVFPEAKLPQDYLVGGQAAGDSGAWWRFKRLLTAVEIDFGRHAQKVHRAWKDFEEEVEPMAARIVSEVGGENAAERRAILSRFMDDIWDEASQRLDALTLALES